MTKLLLILFSIISSSSVEASDVKKNISQNQTLSDDKDIQLEDPSLKEKENRDIEGTYKEFDSPRTTLFENNIRSQTTDHKQLVEPKRVLRDLTNRSTKMVRNETDKKLSYENVYPLFLNQELERGLSKEDLNQELLYEEYAFADFLNNLEIEKKNIKDKRQKRLSREQLTDLFEIFVSDSYVKLEVNDFILYFSPATLDLKRKDVTEVNNLKRLSLGLSPIGADGKEMNFHHLTKYDALTHPYAGKSLIILITSTFHKKHSENLHLSHDYYMGPKKPVDRIKWNNQKKILCKELFGYFK